MVGSKRFFGIVAAIFAIAAVAAPASAAPTSWRFTKTPTTAHASLVMAHLSCATPRSCLALAQSPQQVQQWNGRRWTVLPAAPRFSTDVECPTTTMCVAIGGWNNRPSADTWDGVTWTPNTLPGPGGYGVLNGVSCVSATWCMAAGRGAKNPFFERFDGKKWTLVTAPTSLHGNAMYDVSCTSTTSCVAVGVTFSCRTCHTSNARAATWDGVQWTTTRTPPSPGPVYSDLLRVSCGAANRCLAVGQHSDPDFDYPLLVAWSGRRWTELPEPVPPGAGGSHVEDVSCAHGVDCVAVGDWYSPDGQPAAFGQLIAVWNGTAWSYPDVAVHPQGDLHAVDCVDRRHCVAVGEDFGDSFYRPLAFVGTSPPPAS